jgi:uncharacterized membrane protein YgaE (UPF0421/DUF939 family)
VVLAAVAAACSWLIAHGLLGHPQPFFAPIAAVISLSTSRIQRSRRIAQMVAGVLLGIGIGEVLSSALGNGTLALGLIVFVTLSAALISGVGFFNEGMMFANQAAASAILVVTVHRVGTGGERAVDALVGGGVALVLGVVLFPAEPLSLVRDAETSLLRALAETLEGIAAMPAAHTPVDDDWVLEKNLVVQAQLSALARARQTARANVRVAPRRWRLRQVVDEENRRTLTVDLLATAVLGLLRAATLAVEGNEPAVAARQRHITELAAAVRALARAPRPWPAEVRESVRAAASVAIDSSGVDRRAVVDWTLWTTASDLARVVDSAA